MSSTKHVPVNSTPPKSRDKATGNDFFKQIVRFKLVELNSPVVFHWNDTDYEGKLVQDDQANVFVLYKGQAYHACGGFTKEICGYSSTGYNKNLFFGKNKMPYQELVNQLKKMEIQEVPQAYSEKDPRFGELLSAMVQFFENFKTIKDQQKKLQAQEDKALADITDLLKKMSVKQEDE